VSASEWSKIVAQLNLVGPAGQLAAHSVLLAKEGNRIRLALDGEAETYRRPALEERLTQALSTYFGETVVVEMSLAAQTANTPARQQKAAADDRLQSARAAIDNDPNISAMRDVFGATVQPDSIRPAD